MFIFSLPFSGLFGSKRIILHYMYLFCHLLPIFNFEMQLGILLKTLTLICAIAYSSLLRHWWSAGWSGETFTAKGNANCIKGISQHSQSNTIGLYFNRIKSKFGNQIKSHSHTHKKKKRENRTKSNFWVLNSWFLVKLVLKITCVENHFNHFMRLCCYWS